MLEQQKHMMFEKAFAVNVMFNLMRNVSNSHPAVGLGKRDTYHFPIEISVGLLEFIGGLM